MNKKKTGGPWVVREETLSSVRPFYVSHATTGAALKCERGRARRWGDREQANRAAREANALVPL